jgi:hypothetical protein
MSYDVYAFIAAFAVSVINQGNRAQIEVSVPSVCAFYNSGGISTSVSGGSPKPDRNPAMA